MILIYPPVAKPSEPPAGIAWLAAALSDHGISCRVLDANIEALLSVVQTPRAASDTWTQRAVRGLPRTLASFRGQEAYRSLDRYKRAVKDLGRVLKLSAGDDGEVVGLADYQHPRLSPVRSADLISAAEHPERNPFYPYFEKRLGEVIERDPGGRVGFSVQYLSQALCAFAMIGHVRKTFPGVKIVLGGGLVTSWRKHCGERNPFAGLVDDLIAGPGEKPLLDLLGARGARPRHVTPEYGSLPIHDYLSPGLILPYSASSGCYWSRCSFCPEGAEENRYAPVPTGQVMTDLAALAGKTQPVLIHLLDNALSPALLAALAKGPPGPPWYGFARVRRELADGDYCSALARSGCVMLQLGLESGDQGVLDRLEKGIDLETASAVLASLKKAGIAAYVYLLFGTPAETIDEARKTLDFVVRHQEEVSYLNLAVFNMPVCGREAGEVRTDPFYEGDLSLYTGFKHPRGWDRKLVRRFLEDELKRDPAVSAILKRDPPVFTSNHAAFFTPGWAGATAS